MSIEFPYTCRVDKTISTCRCDDPLVPLILHFAGNKIKTDGLVDSGCSITHANADIARVLGVILENPPCMIIKSIGISGKSEPVTGYLTTVEFQIEGQKNIFNGPILYVENLPYQVLLGQDNFFDQYNVHFKKSKGIFILDEVKKSPKKTNSK